MCTSLYGLRFKCQCSHNSQKGDLKPDRGLCFGSSVQLQSQMDLLLPNAMIVQVCFCKRAACTSKDDIQAQTKHSRSMSAPEHSQLNLLSVGGITICMEQSISQSPHFLLSNQRGGQCAVGNLLAAGCQNGPWTGSHDSCVTVACQS